MLRLLVYIMNQVCFVTCTSCDHQTYMYICTCSRVLTSFIEQQSFLVVVVGNSLFFWIEAAMVGIWVLTLSSHVVIGWWSSLESALLLWSSQSWTLSLTGSFLAANSLREWSASVLVEAITAAPCLGGSSCITRGLSHKDNSRLAEIAGLCDGNNGGSGWFFSSLDRPSSVSLSILFNVSYTSGLVATVVSGIYIIRG